MVDAIRAGQPVLLPTDTVYGLCADASEHAAAPALPAQGTRRAQPTTLVAADLGCSSSACRAVRRSGRIAGALLPGVHAGVLEARPASSLAIGARPTRSASASPAGRRRSNRLELPARRGREPDQVGPRSRRFTTYPRSSVRPAVRPSTPASFPGSRVDGARSHGREASRAREGAVPAAEALSRLAEIAAAAPARTRSKCGHRGAAEPMPRSLRDDETSTHPLRVDPAARSPIDNPPPPRVSWPGRASCRRGGERRTAWLRLAAARAVAEVGEWAVAAVAEAEAEEAGVVEVPPPARSSSGARGRPVRCCSRDPARTRGKRAPRGRALRRAPATCSRPPARRPART